VLFRSFADPAAFDLVAASFSTDGGRTWTTPKTLAFAGLPAGYQRPFDPTITVREDGSLRLYFTCSPSGPNPVNGFCSATSTDGLNFTVDPGQRFYPGRSTVDCAAIRWNGQWHLTSPIGAPQEGAYHAVSDDGLIFTRLADIPSVNNVNWTGNLVAVGNAGQVIVARRAPAEQRHVHDHTRAWQRIVGYYYDGRLFTLFRAGEHVREWFEHRGGKLRRVARRIDVVTEEEQPVGRLLRRDPPARPPRAVQW